jgi:hypothetical protein
MAEGSQGSSVKGVAEQAADTLDDVSNKAQQTALQLKDQGSSRVRQEFDQRSTKAGQQVRSLADALRRGTAQLEQQRGGSTQLTEQVADRVDRFGAYLERTSSDELIRDVESFARRRPWMVAGLGSVAGLALARFVKASSEHRYGSYRVGNRDALPVSGPRSAGGVSDTWTEPVRTESSRPASAEDAGSLTRVR